MQVQIMPAKLTGTLKAISSKSDVHRLLIAAALAKTQTTININGLSQDIIATIDCLQQLGGEITHTENQIIVTPIKIKITPPILDCNESGSTARFLLPVAAVLYDNFAMTGRGNLPNRPFEILMQQMAINGCNFNHLKLPCEVTGKLTSGDYKLAGNVSSQFISGLLFALPLLAGDSRIYLTSPLESSGYVDMTIATLKIFGVDIQTQDNGYLIPGGQEYLSPTKITAEGDWSNCAFWLSAAAINGNISLSDLNPNSLQKDKEITNLLQQFGCQIQVSENIIRGEKNLLQAIEINASEIPDLVPILSVVAALSPGITKIYNAGRLKIKESNRLEAISNTLNKLGGQVEISDDTLLITGKPKLTGGTIDSYNDHRIAMAAAIASLGCTNPVIIKNCQAINKSYPTFLEDYHKLGGVYNVM